MIRFASFHLSDLAWDSTLIIRYDREIEDLAHQRAELENGQQLTLYGEDLEVDGVVEFSEEEKIWVAVIDWNTIREVEVLAVQGLT